MEKSLQQVNKHTLPMATSFTSPKWKKTMLKIILNIREKNWLHCDKGMFQMVKGGIIRDKIAEIDKTLFLNQVMEQSIILRGTHI